MTGTFQYTVLKYRHSFIAGEVLNIGILFLLADGRIEFHYPSKLSRISSLYPKFPTSFVKNTLSSFKSTASKLSKKPNANIIYQESFESLLNNNFLTISSGSLFFDEVKQGVSISDNKSLVEHYYNLYLGNYEEETHLIKNEKYILDKVKTIIKDRFSPVIESKLRVNKVINDPNGNFTESFDYGWLNGKLNLITPIGFDLAQEQTFENKAFRWNAILNFLKEPAEKENIKFDILLTKPTDKHLERSYFKARDIIERSNAPLKFVEENEFNSYLKKAVDVVLDHNPELTQSL
ncbi:DUF3037 domain-containing protein [Pontibacter sp. FD36]|uniref:DUF3037 domain-containing protein n=1 Tax=Pontibacter sp. FD36 TaxID=2789860 RepID=UPI0018A939BA|nr:DUF3037 domain-containing protein [Pontibacter sp. FD36]MBF8962951.1 DUF3037 domain-containing protein [Pontibacter sp. FD36]